MADFRSSNPTVQSISVGDSINYKGSTYQVASITSSGTNTEGWGIATVVLNDAKSTSLSLSDTNTVCVSYSANSPTTTKATWSQTANA